MSRFFRTLLIVLFLLSIPVSVLAQSEEFHLRARRDFGYGNGSDVRGNFSLTVEGDQSTIQSVTYLMDNQPINTAAQSPFKFSFNTSSYPHGVHQITAVVTKKDGSQVTTQTVSLNFLSADQESSSMQRILVPLLGGILLIMLIGVGSQVLMMRQGSGKTAAARRNYGFKGGTICPRCGRPYAIHFWSINLIGGVLDRCDYCGKWAFVTRRRPDELAAAEQAEDLAEQVSESMLPGAEPQSDEDRMKKLLDDSKFTE